VSKRVNRAELFARINSAGNLPLHGKGSVKEHLINVFGCAEMAA